MEALPLLEKPSWAFYPVGDFMQRISLSWFANVGAVLSPVADSMKVTELTVLHLFHLREPLNVLSNEQTYPLDLRSSRPVILQLLNRLNYILNEQDAQQQTQKLDAERWNIWSDASRLETLLGAELAVQPVYHLWPIRAYNTEVLIAQGENVFSEEAKKAFNEEEVYNLREAGKCLAFQIPTAAAFHIFRCVESLIRRYYQVVVGNLPKPKMRNWGAYIKNLRQCGADEKVIAILEQIKDLHRNPVIHPEVRMANDEALSLIGIIDSAITAIVLDMKKRQENPRLPFPVVAPDAGETLKTILSS
jgi:hypothetical protein